MRIELRVRQILEELGKNEYGIESKMARELKLNRHTIRNILHNQAVKPSLDTLGRICVWLLENGAPPEWLPGRLLGARPSGLWAAIGGMPKVAFFLGLYDHRLKGAYTDDYLTIAHYDGAVLSKMIQHLSSSADTGTARPVIHVQYVPFHHVPKSKRTGDWFHDDKKRALETFRRMRESGAQTATLMLGSQRVNYLVECFVANLFGCEPFSEPPPDRIPPVYLCYRDSDPAVNSCFGGHRSPDGTAARGIPGTYYRDEDGWRLTAWEENRTDSGIVIVIREETRLEMALFGLSGRATSAIGNAVITRSHLFYPDCVEEPEKDAGPRGKELYIFVCEVQYDGGTAKPRGAAWTELDARSDHVTVIPISEAALDTCKA